MIYEKISSGLLVALQEYEERGSEGLIPQMNTLGVIPSVETIKPPRTVVFIYCDENADLSHLEGQGIQINQSSGRVRTAFLPLERLGMLSEDANIERIKPSRYLRSLMDVAIMHPQIEAQQFRQNSALTGKDVIIGVIDTGIDPNHPAFAGRILRVWDQSMAGPGVPEGNYGLEVVEGAIAASRDINGHGTHVAGIAGGIDETFGGIAPEAEFIIVKTDFQDAHIADGVRYIFRVAREMNRPAVANLSLGGHADAHDGTDSLSQIIDAESGPGRIVCCAAGNEGNDNIHAQSDLEGGATSGMRLRVPNNSTSVVLLNGWYSGNIACEISLRSPGGFVTPWQKIITSGNPTQTYTLPDARVQIVTPGPDPFNNDYNFFVQILGRSQGGAVAGGNWQLRVLNTSNSQGRLDVWALDGRGGSQVMFTGKNVQDSMKIGSPGCSAESVTVASYTTKVEYTDIDNQQRTVGLTLNDISDFSSEGPLRDGSPKPDVAAPGAMIVAPLSADAQDTTRGQMVNAKYMANAGTSMAAPFVTGIIALLLQRDRNLTPEAVKALLQKSSRIPGKCEGTFDPKWGYGLMNALELQKKSC
ncbi:MAG: S8 family peptidase [Cyanobacteriota bacterium]|nr:S8 family peptidase [Cyanobacteriota bacterium]